MIKLRLRWGGGLCGALLAATAMPVIALSGSAFAKSEGIPLVGKKHDSKTPIDISSDALDVLQAKNQAVFTGHVVAIQGDVRLKADKMIVTYSKPPQDKVPDKTTDKAADTATEKKTPAETRKSGAKASGDVKNNGIKKIDVEGSVFLTTQEETASGATGTYDVEHQEIHLHDHVVLTKGENVLKGDHLVYNFTTGKSTLSSDKPTTTDAKGSGRVRALFVPGSDKK